MEVCVDNVNSAITADQGGASRIELCGSLSDGGITPSLGLFRVVKRSVSVPVYVMIRPRDGDFLYTDSELEVMKEDIKTFLENKADGFVFGILTKEGAVDVRQCQELLNLCHGAPVTFHRAFDMVNNYKQALEDVISLGFSRILTSGLDSTCLEGLDTLRELVYLARGRIIIVPGGGINERNIGRILEGCGASEFHCSARSSIPSEMEFRRTWIHMGAGYFNSEYSRKECDTWRLKMLKSLSKE